MLLAAVDFDNLHQVLRVLYDEMMPLCSNMTGVAKGIAGLGALFYVAAKVWQSLARAEPIDVYPLLRPFALGLCIMLPIAFIRRAVESQHPVGVVLLLRPQVGHGYVLAGVVVHKVAVVEQTSISVVDDC